jgi:hypothetical protein
MGQQLEECRLFTLVSAKKRIAGLGSQRQAACSQVVPAAKNSCCWHQSETTPAHRNFRYFTRLPRHCTFHS